MERFTIWKDGFKNKERISFRQNVHYMESLLYYTRSSRSELLGPKMCFFECSMPTCLSHVEILIWILHVGFAPFSYSREIWPLLSSYTRYYSGIRIFCTTEYSHQNLMDGFYFRCSICSTIRFYWYLHQTVICIKFCRDHQSDANIRIPLYYYLLLVMGLTCSKQEGPDKSAYLLF